jgi:hypothetical protein
MAEPSAPTEAPAAYRGAFLHRERTARPAKGQRTPETLLLLRFHTASTLSRSWQARIDRPRADIRRGSNSDRPATERQTRFALSVALFRLLGRPAARPRTLPTRSGLLGRNANGCPDVRRTFISARQRMRARATTPKDAGRGLSQSRVTDVPARTAKRPSDSSVRPVGRVWYKLTPQPFKRKTNRFRGGVKDEDGSRHAARRGGSFGAACRLWRKWRL